MIYTLTLNPSLDYLLDTPDLKMGETNRSTSESLHFGGKGINVSYVLKQLGKDSVCFGFTAGFTGKELEKKLCEEGMKHDFVFVENGNTRINVKLRSKEITEVNATGPVICKGNVDELFEKLCNLSENDTLILAGSTPKGLEDVYVRIIERLSGKGVRFVVDTSGKKLLECLKFKPFLIKPNKAELEEIEAANLETDEDIVASAKKLKKLGAVNVLVSLGENGAILLDENWNVHKVNPIKIIPVNTVGAGDSMVAGFLAGCEKGYEYAIKLANACGAATAMSTVLADRETIDKLM